MTAVVNNDRDSRIFKAWERVVTANEQLKVVESYLNQYRVEAERLRVVVQAGCAEIVRLSRP